MSEPIGDFQGTCDSSAESWIKGIFETPDMFKSAKANKDSVVDSRNVNLAYLESRVERIGDLESQLELLEEVEHRIYTDTIFEMVFPEHEDLDLDEEPTNFDCLRFMVDTY